MNRQHYNKAGIAFVLILFFVFIGFCIYGSTESFQPNSSFLPPTGGGNNPLQPHSGNYDIVPPVDGGDIFITYPDVEAVDGYGVGAGLGGSFSNEWEYL
jgi:hypothetical protein